MRPRLAIFLILAMCPLWAAGQTPAPIAPTEPPAGADVPPGGYEPLALRSVAVADDRDQRYAFDLILGFPTGVRAGRAFGPEPERGWLLEGFAGVDLIFPTLGGGIRKRFVPLCDAKNSLVISPGLDAYVLFSSFYTGSWFGGGPNIKLFTADVEVAWQRTLRQSVASELGVKIGGGPGYGTRWGFLPVFGAFFGCRF